MALSVTYEAAVDGGAWRPVMHWEHGQREIRHVARYGSTGMPLPPHPSPHHTCFTQMPAASPHKCPLPPSRAANSACNYSMSTRAGEHVQCSITGPAPWHPAIYPNPRRRNPRPPAGAGLPGQAPPFPSGLAVVVWPDGLGWTLAGFATYPGETCARAWGAGKRSTVNAVFSDACI